MFGGGAPPTVIISAPGEGEGPIKSIYIGGPAAGGGVVNTWGGMRVLGRRVVPISSIGAGSMSNGIYIKLIF